MGLTAAALKQVQTLLGRPVPTAQRITSVRKGFPALSLTRCGTSDRGVEVPLRETPEFYVYLLDTSEHCARITSDPAVATGLIVAEKG